MRSRTFFTESKIRIAVFILVHSLLFLVTLAKAGGEGIMRGGTGTRPYILNLAEDTGFYHRLFGLVFPIGLLKEGAANGKNWLKSARYKPASSPKLSIG
jgi:hypothetical protein